MPPRAKMKVEWLIPDYTWKQDFLRAVERFLPGRSGVLKETRESPYTTAWGVNWTDPEIARDIAQNFLDSTDRRADLIRIVVDDSDVQFSSPAHFDLERLWFLGSEKKEDALGRYGEGFKAAAVCYLRQNPNSLMIATSADQMLVIHLSDQAVEGTEIRPLVYEFIELDQSTEGNRLILLNASESMQTAMKDGLNNFFFDGNPILGKVLVDDRRFTIYESTKIEGAIFYRGVLRARVGFPVVINICRPYAEVEKLTRADRDRQAFGDGIKRVLFKLIAKSFVYPSSLFHILDASRNVWEKGHPLLAAIGEQTYTGVLRGLSEQLFEKKYFAVTRDKDPAQQLRIDQIEKQWRAEGLTPLAAYFRKFGVASAHEELALLDEKARKEMLSAGQRAPLHAENTCIHFLEECTEMLSRTIYSGLFNSHSIHYSVASTEHVLGMFEETRRYGEYRICFADSIFTQSFPIAFSTFLHEAAHFFGRDGSRGFSDALTDLIAELVGQPEEIARMTRDWGRLVARVKREREQLLLEEEAKIEKPARDKVLHQLSAAVMNQSHRFWRILFGALESRPSKTKGSI